MAPSAPSASSASRSAATQAAPAAASESRPSPPSPVSAPPAPRAAPIAAWTASTTAMSPAAAAMNCATALGSAPVSPAALHTPIMCNCDARRFAARGSPAAPASHSLVALGGLACRVSSSCAAAVARRRSGSHRNPMAIIAACK
eukprot:770281-Pleurochrysis_carterae.AAC.1